MAAIVKSPARTLLRRPCSLTPCNAALSRRCHHKTHPQPLNAHTCSNTTTSPASASVIHRSNTQALHFSSSATATDNNKLETGLQYNKDTWAATYADRFPELASGQKPQILWIGCSDSRCPETSLLGLNPGDVFVHRNIANIVHEADLSSSCVIDFAVGVLKVNHIVLCGHTACGGVNAALGNAKLGILDTWLLPLRKLRQANLGALKDLEKPEAIVKLAELNVLDGINKIKEKGVVIDAIEQRGLKVHGVIYDVASGLLRSVDGGEESQDAVKARLTAFKIA
jgi:carbonic anhydrase